MTTNMVYLYMCIYIVYLVIQIELFKHYLALIMAITSISYYWVFKCIQFSKILINYKQIKIEEQIVLLLFF